MKLPEREADLLRRLVLFGSAAPEGLDVEAFLVLEADGYARRAKNGTGFVYRTKRGVLKALADGIIKRHPDADLPAGAMLP